MGASALASCETIAACSPNGEWDPTGRPVPEPAFQSMFDGIDKNKDGKLDRIEWRDAFDVLDADGSGWISRQEWELQMGHVHMFDVIDRDRGGTITREEWDRAFDMFDKNRDDVICTSEWETWSLKVRKRTAASDNTPAFSKERKGSLKPIMGTNVRVCLAAKVLRFQMEEGFDHSREWPDARRVLVAAKSGSVDATLQTLKESQRGAWSEVCDNAGDTVMHFASRQGHVHLVGLLLKMRARLDAQNVRGETPLHGAVDGGYAEVVELLCSSKADPFIGDLQGNEVPGMWAVRRHAERACQRRLLSNCSENDCKGREHERLCNDVVPNMKEHRDRRFACIEKCLDAMRCFSSDIPPATNLLNTDAVTGLHVAAEASDLPVCKVLLSFSAKVNAADHFEGATPLMYALRSIADVSVAKLLLSSNARLRQRDRCAGSHLHYAVAAGDDAIALVELLIRTDACVDARDEKGASVLALAGLRGAPAIVRCLLAAGAHPKGCCPLLDMFPVDARDSDGRSCRDILEAVSIGQLPKVVL